MWGIISSCRELYSPRPYSARSDHAGYDLSEEINYPRNVCADGTVNMRCSTEQLLKAMILHNNDKSYGLFLKCMYSILVLKYGVTVYILDFTGSKIRV